MKVFKLILPATLLALLPFGAQAVGPAKFKLGGMTQVAPQDAEVKAFFFRKSERRTASQRDDDDDD